MVTLIKVVAVSALLAVLIVIVVESRKLNRQAAQRAADQLVRMLR
jgi:hypothetical protein